MKQHLLAENYNRFFKGSLNEYDEDEEEVTYFEISNGTITLSLQKNNDKWRESPKIVDGNEEDLPYGWGSKRYESYLTPEDILQWINKDYADSDGGRFEIVDTTDEEDEEDEEDLSSHIKDYEFPSS